MKTIFHTNGYLVVSQYITPEMDYQGVYGDIWPLENVIPNTHKVLLKNLGWDRYPYGIDVATKWETTYQYWKLCKENKITTNLLLLETELIFPLIQIEKKESWKFLGFDYAYNGGDFYSAIQQELIVPTQPPFCILEWKDKLNRFGLFSTYADIDEFRIDRESCTEGIEKSGNLFIIKVSKYNETQSSEKYNFDC